MSISRNEFLLKEVEQVRASYGEFVEETRRLERYAVLITGAIWSWCAANPAGDGVSMLMWFPAVACALFALRSAGIYHQSRAARYYIATVETMFGLDGDLGWARVQIQRSKGMPALVAATAYVFWGVLCICASELS